LAGLKVKQRLTDITKLGREIPKLTEAATSSQAGDGLQSQQVQGKPELARGERVPAEEGGTIYRALAGQRRGAGKTPGEALDAILDQDESAALVVVQRNRPDRFFSAEQQRRLEELMARWRASRDAGSTLASQEQQELDQLIDAELRAAGQRAVALATELAG
jgi:hypothetical protein